jgi:hypothetical protein
MACLLVILVIVMAVILLAVSPSSVICRLCLQMCSGDIWRNGTRMSFADRSLDPILS